MSTVLITGWRPGLAEVSMPRAIRARAGLGLAAAKRVTDDVLEGRPAAVACPSRSAAVALAAELGRLGAVARLDPGSAGAGVA